MTNMNGATLKDQVYATVMHDLISGSYNVESVLSEKKLSEQMKVSKAPVREALVELCAQGVLRSIPRQGYMVVRYTEREVQEMLQYRILLECGSLESCFDQITPVQLRHLESAAESEFLYHSMRDAKDFWNRTANFHLTLISFSGNEYVFNSLKTVLGACLRAYQQLCFSQIHDDLPELPMTHKEIVDCIRRGDKEHAVAALRRDICTFFTPEDIKKESRNDG
ncbi:MAG: GntR family transcriptional regulator [Eubacteriales bacterium]|nr:GntR family transcriptional regulator [Eubacteriales bacterium]